MSKRIVYSVRLNYCMLQNKETGAMQQPKYLHRQKLTQHTKSINLRLLKIPSAVPYWADTATTAISTNAASNAARMFAFQKSLPCLSEIAKRP